MSGLSVLYGGGVALRRAWLRRRPPGRLGVPVISIGNLTVGGTGKTAAVAKLAGNLITRGIRVGILTRGYARRSREAVVVVSEGNGPIVKAAVSGDEAYSLAEQLPQAVVVVGANRLATGAHAVERLGCRLLILDDGFQRRDQVYRDLDIVLVDAADPFGGKGLLPAGRLREPLSALAEADLVVVTRTDQHSVRAFLPRLQALAPGKPVLFSTHAPREVWDFPKRRRHPADWLQGRPLVAVAGIGRPEAFAGSLRTLGARVVSSLWFPDHHWYTLRDLARMRREALECGAELVTTRKDAVRLEALAVPDFSFLVLDIEFFFSDPAGGWDPWVERLLPGSAEPRGGARRG